MMRRSQAGFSLLEMLVAIAIMGLCLGALYQAVAGASHNVRLDEHYSYASTLAESLLANYQQVPIEGLQESGETEGGYAWQVDAQPNQGEYPERMKLGSLQDVVVTVSWNDGDRQRQFQLESVVAGVESDLP
ncbi:MAG: prepilin-type N-terminal cleavage/methylation domain-containing protein [Cellvibrionaceae bacterium]|nr:prepilin-type N-terminal cleavage/methylation domain-containing protein [Cellvibrionaceae bacterium]